MIPDYSESRELAQATRIASRAEEMALAMKIDDQQSLDIAGQELQRIVQRRKEIEELRLSLTRPLDDSKRRIMDLFRVPTDRLAEAEGLLRKGIVAFQAAEREKEYRLRREAEERARVEQERLQRERAAAEAEERRIREEAAQKERERLAEIERARAAGNTAAAAEAERLAREEAAQAEAAASEARARADEAQADLEVAEVAPVMPLQVAAKAAGIGSRQNWKHEVTDLRALVSAAAAGLARGDTNLLGYLQANDKAIGAVVKSLKANTQIPGVRVYAEDGLSVRRAG